MMNGLGFRRRSSGIDVPLPVRPPAAPVPIPGRPPSLQQHPALSNNPRLLQGPDGRTLFESYRKDVLNNFQEETPRYNLMNPDRPQSSMLVDLKDPIQVHLLTETALADSHEFEILSQEEVDGLKKQCQSLTQRIHQTRTNLAIQSKYRDAATSMSKLYSPTRTESKRRSLLGNRHSGGENAKEAEVERQASERKCEELSSELWTLEKRLTEPQRRLLQHTAGILQLTHRESKKKNQPQPRQLAINGMPGSPESMYTYSNSRSSFDNAPVNDNYLQDSYGGLDQDIDTWSRPQNPPIEIPLRSPIREQAKEMRLETDRLKEDNGRLQQEGEELRQENMALSSQATTVQQESSLRMKTIEGTEQKLEELNTRLRDVIIKMNPMNNRQYISPPYGLRNGTARALEAGDMMGSQLDYMEKGLVKIEEDSETQTSEVARRAEGKIEGINQQISKILAGVDPSYPMPPIAIGPSALDEHVGYLQNALGAVQDQLARAAKMSDSSSAERHKSKEVEAVLGGLWDTIQAGLADLSQRKQQRQRAMKEQGVEDNDMSDAEDFDPQESYSLQTFSAKVKWLYAQATSLKEQKVVLKRQIKQQRELNNKSDAERDSEIQRKNDEIITTKNTLSKTVSETQDVRAQLAKAMQNLEDAQMTRATNEAASSKSTQEQLKVSTGTIAKLEATARDLEAKSNIAEQGIASLTLQLKEANAAQENAEKALTDKEKSLKAKEDELDQLNMMVVGIKTELTFAKAELDGAYGSRAERAAEAAALTGSAETIQLQERAKQLEGELATTLKEFEEMTKETINQEKEKLELESKLDDALSGHSELEDEVKSLRDRLDREVGDNRGKLSKLQDELDKEKLKVRPGQTAAKPGAGASMLSEQFRTTMREERKKYQEDMRKEVSERRKLEDELRILRKQVGPGKSPLSPR